MQQLRLDQSREHVRSWKKCYPATPDQEIVDRTKVVTGLDVSAALSDPGEPISSFDFYEDLAKHGRVTCAIAIVKSFFYCVEGAEDLLAKCLKDQRDFEIFRLCWVLLEKPPRTHASAFERLAARMNLAEPIKPLIASEVGPQAPVLAYLGHTVVW